MDKISIIIPVYNSEDYLQRCIKSIINQSYDNLEIILVNDGSTDNSLEICKKFASIDKRIIIIDKKNEGVSVARNVGIDSSTGNYIAFVDSDDFIDENMYADMIEAQKKNRVDVIECGYSYYYGDEKSKVMKLKQNKQINKEQYLMSLFKVNETTPAVWNKLYKKQLINKIRFQNLRYSEDLLFNVNVGLILEKKATLEKSYYYYYQNKNGVKHSSFSEKKIDDIIAREKIIELLAKQKENYSEVIKIVHIDILKRIMSLYIEMEQVDIENKNRFREYFDRTFTNHYKFIESSDIDQIKSFKYRFLLKLYLKSPQIYKVFTRLYAMSKC